MSKKHIEECIRDSLEGYFKDLRGVEPSAMYDMIINVVEKPLLDVVMKKAEGKSTDIEIIAVNDGSSPQRSKRAIFEHSVNASPALRPSSR